MGCLIIFNFMNLGYVDVVKVVFDDFGYDLNEIEFVEIDVGFGNGGLGWLVVCFFDLVVLLLLFFYGNLLRYKKGFFV